MGQTQNEIKVIINDMIDAKLNAVNTALPGTIVSYDAATNRAQVQPSGTYQCPDDRRLSYPVIHNVPIIMQTSAGGSSGITVPVKVGDGVLLHFSQSQLDSFLNGSDSVDKRRHDMNDCIATLGLTSDASDGQTAHPNDTVISNGATQIILSTDSIRMTAGGSTLVLGSAGLVVNGVNLSTHTHSDPQGGKVGPPE